MNVLVIVAHPNLEQSRVNKRWLAELQKQPNVRVHNLYAEYPDFKVNVQREQQLLVEADRIVLQFPFYWYSTPALLKQWFDDVLTYGWAYGSDATTLHGKELVVAMSTGGPGEAYQAGGYNHYTLSELLRPIQATSNLIGTRYLPIFAVQGIFGLSDADLDNSAEAYVQHILAEYPTR